METPRKRRAARIGGENAVRRPSSDEDVSWRLHSLSIISSPILVGNFSNVRRRRRKTWRRRLGAIWIYPGVSILYLTLNPLLCRSYPLTVFMCSESYQTPRKRRNEVEMKKRCDLEKNTVPSRFPIYTSIHSLLFGIIHKPKGLRIGLITRGREEWEETQRRWRSDWIWRSIL